MCLPCQLGREHNFKHCEQFICSGAHGSIDALRRSKAAFGNSSYSACLVRNKILRVGCYPGVFCTRPFDAKPVAYWIKESLDVLSSACLAFHFKRKLVWDILSPPYFLSLNSSVFKFALMKKSCYMLPL